MTREQKLQFIREKAIVANPEICEADKGFRNIAKTGWQYAYLDKNGRNQHSEQIFKTQKEAYKSALVLVDFLLGKSASPIYCLR